MSSSDFNRGRSRFSRRNVLRGAGVALALPWLESLARSANAQAVAMPKRFVAIFLPCGAPEFWKPPTAGAGDAWQLSSVLDLLGPLKAKVNVMSGFETGSVFNADGSSQVEPVDGTLPGAWLTCANARAIKQQLNVLEGNGISADQIMAANAVFAGKTALPSMQIGLSSVLSYCDGQQCSNSRSVSWQTETKPLYKLVDPLAVFNQIAGVLPGAGDPAAVSARRDERLSVLDAVQESAAAARGRLSASDKQRLDEFLTSVRSVEKRVTDGTTSSCGVLPAKPVFPAVDPLNGVTFRQNIGGYNKGVHFDLMNELLALALQCDLTRLVSFMLEDERSEFVCDHIPMRTFSALTSTAGVGVCGEWHGGGQQGSQDMFGSIVRWNVGKVGELCQKLDSVLEANGKSVLDNSVIFLGAAIHGSAESAANLPSLTIGGGGGALKTNQHVDLGRRPLRDFYFTLMNGVYDLGVADFGTNATGAPASMIQQLLT